LPPTPAMVEPIHAHYRATQPPPKQPAANESQTQSMDHTYGRPFVACG
jgi:hypothetical protein